jgi:hypothetical protein
VRYAKTEGGYAPDAKSFYFIQSLPFMMNQYDAILGLSGSLGSPAEQAFMRATYGVRTMATPPFLGARAWRCVLSWVAAMITASQSRSHPNALGFFFRVLDTCQRMTKPQPRLHDGCVLIKDSWEDQVRAVRELALDFCQRVPVVILANDLATAKRLYAECFPPAEVAGRVGIVQQFYSVDPETNKKSDFKTIIERATKDMGMDDGRVLWPITVTDPFGGRGIDYAVTADSVNKHGGLMVICTAIPDSQREWTQWVGRTARSDREGQYAVVLLRTEKLVDSCKDALVQHQISPLTPNRYRSTVIDLLLGERDKAIKVLLDGMAHDLEIGKRLHELCYAFWCKQPGGCNVAEWPATDAQRKLRAFLELSATWAQLSKCGGMNAAAYNALKTDARSALYARCMATEVHSPDAVAAFAVEVGLAHTAAEYKRNSDYCR